MNAEELTKMQLMQELTALRQQVAALTTWLTSPQHKQLIKDEFFTFMVVAPTKRRRDHLRFWTAEELVDRDLEAYRDLYTFTDTNPTTVSPDVFFCEKHWYAPTLKEPDSLIERPEQEVSDN